MRSFARRHIAVAVIAAFAVFFYGFQSRQPSEATGTGITYVYDEIGRLVAVVDPATNTAKYSYDAVGNITSISRYSSATVSLIEFTPNGASAGDTVTIFGTGFGATPGDNTVRFNGTLATVTSASPTKLVTTVPSGATNGTISVTSPAGSATSAATFTVLGSLLPTISGFNPPVATPGSTVTISGTNFDTTRTNDVVSLNANRAIATAATATSLSVTVPQLTSSGRVSVATPYGKVTGGDLFVAPPPLAASDIEYTGRAALDTQQRVTIGTADKAGLLLFDGVAGNRIYVSFRNGTIPGSTVTIYNPDMTALVQAFVGATGDFDTRVLPQTGTYAILVDPSGTGTGVLDVTVHDVPPDATGTITIGGPDVTTPTTSIGQNSSLTFSGTQGQRIFTYVVASTYGGGCRCATVNIKNPDGSTLIDGFPGAGEFYDTLTLPATGTYRLNIDPWNTYTGNMTLRLYDVPPDGTGTIAIGGPDVTTPTTSVGQGSSLTFSGTQGQRIFTYVVASTYCGGGRCVSITIKNPDGSVLIDGFPGAGEFYDTLELTQTGTFTIKIDPWQMNTGNMTLRLYDVPPDGTGTITIGGPDVVTPTTSIGQNSSLTFSGAQGQRIFTHVVASSYCGGGRCVSITIKNPDGTQLFDGFPGAGESIDTLSLPQTGTYTMYLNPWQMNTGNMTLRLYDVPPDGTGTITIDGPDVTTPTTVVGQGSSLTFTGTQGQAIQLSIVGSTYPASELVGVKNPNGSYLVDPFWRGLGSVTNMTLVASGTHTITIDPQWRDTGDFTMRLATQGGGLAPQSFVSSETTVDPSLDATPHRAPSSKATPTARRAPRDRFSGLRPAGAEAWRPSGNRTTWTTGRAPSPWQDLALATSSFADTALSGQVLTLNGGPLRNVTLEIDEQSTRTDATGRFLLTGLESGRHEMVIDGRSANVSGRTYGLFEVGVDLRAGVTNELPYTIWMPLLDTENEQAIASPTTTKTIVKTPEIPGLELHLQAGTVITDEDGEVVTKLGITAIPVDRPPFPLPVGVNVPIYFTIQPGASYLSKPARIIYPNYTHAAPGTRIDFWHYDPDEKGWYVYGKGTVTANGAQVVPDYGIGIYEFTGAMLGPPENPAATGPVPGGGRDGDPVDLNTGLFVLEKTDIVLQDVLPIALTRTYRQSDGESRAFGIGTSHPYQMFIYGPGQYQQADLILPDGGRIHYVRISPGTGYADAVYEHTTSPTMFYKSRVTWNGAGWDLRLKDGTTYIFGDNAPLIGIRDRHGNKITIYRSNGQRGNITRMRTQNGRWIDFTYDASNRITGVTDSAGRTVGYQYDANGRLWKVTDVLGGVTEYTWGTCSGVCNQMASIKDPRQITFLTNQYDATTGRVTRQTQADGSSYEFAYTTDGNGKVIQTDVTLVSTDGTRRNTRRVTFNANGHILTDTLAQGRTEQQATTYERDATSNLATAVIDQLGRRTSTVYDDFGNPLSITRLAGTADAVTTTFTYEPTFNQVETVTDPLDHTTTMYYDAAGNLVRAVDPLNHETTFDYNAAGQPIWTKNALLHQTDFAYEDGQLVSVTDPLDRVSRTSYDAMGRAIRSVDTYGGASALEYDAANQLLKSTDALGNVTRFEYDANGNRTAVVDARNGRTEFTFNSMDRAETRKDQLLRTESFAYDEAGNVVRITDRKNQVTGITYDWLQRPSETCFGRTVSKNGTVSCASKITNTFDGGSRLTQAVDTIAGTYTRGWDGLDRLTSETSPQATVAYTYDDASRRATMTVTGQTQVVYTFDSADRLTQIQQGSAIASFGYDDADRSTSTTLPNGVVTTVGYDDASQPTSLTYTKGAATLGDLGYVYDVGGRRTAVTGSWARSSIPNAVTSATYNAANQITNWNGSNVTYDNNGNMLNDGTYNYTWDTRNHLTTVKQNNSTQATYVYDPFGRRQKKTASGTATAYVFDGDTPVQERVGTSVTANMLNGLGTDAYLTRTAGGATSGFVSDALGSTIALTDAAGTVPTSYTYEPYGKTTTTGATNSNTYQFTGREADPAGLYYLRARYYHPTFGRFLSEDPIGFAGGDANLHAYVGGNPTNVTDPTGNCPFCILAAVIIGGAIGGALGYAAGTAITGRKFRWSELGWSALFGAGIGMMFCMALAPCAVEAVGIMGAAAAKIGISSGPFAGKVRNFNTQLFGGRSGEKVKNLVGEPNTIYRGGGERLFVTNEKGQVILDITKERYKDVIPGQGFGDKGMELTQEMQELLKEFFG